MTNAQMVIAGQATAMTPTPMARIPLQMTGEARRFIDMSGVG
jgi:hypothetical protein